MNNGIRCTNAVLQNEYPELNSMIRSVEHPTCRIEDQFYEDGGIRLNRRLGTS